MRLSSMFMPTRKEDPAEAEIASHKLLIRGGFIRMLSRGIYSFLPLGWRSLDKIEQVIRQEMNASGAQEVLLPGVQPAELWQESGRWEDYGPELLRMEDRKGSEFCLGPTHEEVITDLVRGELNSYKQLPINLYQIQTKFRDEPRPRFGLLRAREFIMKDAYSFDIDEEAADESYQQMFDAYARICDRLGFEWEAVEADTGAIGGSRSHEFQVLTETGEDKLVACTSCDYAANIEKAGLPDAQTETSDDEGEALERVETPGKKTIREVSDYLEVSPTQCVKTLVYLADEQPVLVLVRGDHEANDIKVRDFLREQTDLEFTELNMANDAAVRDVTGAPVGFAGPVGLDHDFPVYADVSAFSVRDAVVGANEADAHYTGLDWSRDVELDGVADLRQAEAGDPCPECGEPLASQRGIEVGHVFFLGTKYSDALGATVQDEDGQDRSIAMGCYGMGVTRILAAVAEQNHDEDGLIWPMPLAPFQVTILPLQMGSDEVVDVSEDLYEELQNRGLEVLIDDRDEGVGAKFKDADLIGIPIRVAIGTRGVENDEVEVKLRWEDDDENVPVADAADHIEHLVETASLSGNEDSTA
jgi:prolyl-tRNA synthetase